MRSLWKVRSFTTKEQSVISSLRNSTCFKSVILHSGLKTFASLLKSVFMLAAHLGTYLQLLERRLTRIPRLEGGSQPKICVIRYEACKRICIDVRNGTFGLGTCVLIYYYKMIPAWIQPFCVTQTKWFPATIKCANKQLAFLQHFFTLFKKEHLLNK